MMATTTLELLCLDFLNLPWSEPSQSAFGSLSIERSEIEEGEKWDSREPNTEKAFL